VKSVRRYYRIDRRQIAFLKFIIEAYDGIATLSTIDPRRGVVALDIPPGCASEVDTLLEELGRQMRIEVQERIEF
jgi:hypothetical protein